MSIDSQLLNLTGGIKTSGHIKSNFGATIGVGTDAPTGIVEVQHSQPTLVVQQQATSGGSVTSYGKVHAASGTLHIQSGVDATSDSKGDIVLGSVGSGTKHVVVKGATSRVGIGSDAPAYGLDVVPESRFTGNVITSNISANAITLNELSLGVTQGLDNVVNVDNTTANTIAMSNVNESTSTTTGALTVAGGIGVGGNVHCANLYASNITMNLVSFSGLQTFEQVVNNGRVLNSNVLIISNATPSTSSTTGALTLTGGGLGVAGNVHVGSNLAVTGDATVSNISVAEETALANLSVTGETVEVANLAVTSGSLELTQVSNVFQVKSSANVVTEYVRSKKLIKYPRVAMTAATSGGYTASASSTYNPYYPYLAFDNVAGFGGSDFWHSSQVYTGANGAYSGSNSITDSDGKPYSGEHITLQLANADGRVRLHHVRMHPRVAANVNRMPTQGVFLGSNDGGTTHDTIQTFKGLSWSSNEWQTIQINASGYYSTYTLVTEYVGSDSWLNIGEIEYHGIPEYDPDAHGTDVIARSVPNVPNTDWLEVYYNAKGLSNGSISTVDDLTPGGSNDGAATNLTVSDEAFVFNGTSSHLAKNSMSIPGGNNPFTFSFWVKYNKTSGNQYIFRLGQTNTVYETVGMYINSSGQFVFASWTLDFPLNHTFQEQSRWYHVSLVYPSKGWSQSSLVAYVDGQSTTFGTNLSSGGTGGSDLALATSANFMIGSYNNASDYFNGSIANFRLFNRALTADEVWQLYAYQKDYFQVSPDAVTFKAGRLGIGTLEPKAPLDVMGIPYGPGARPVFFATNNSTSSETITAAGIFTDDLPDAHINVGNCYDGTTGRFTAKIAGVYMFVFNVNVVAYTSSRHFCQTTFYLNGTNVNRATTGRGLGYMIHQAVSHSSGEGLSMEISRPLYLNVGDYVQVGIVQITDADVISGRNYSWFTGYLLS